MENLDRFFKEKLQNREFELKDAYWAEAERLIDKDRRKKRLFWWWGLSGLGLLLLFLIGISQWVRYDLDHLEEKQLPITTTTKAGTTEIKKEAKEVTAAKEATKITIKTPPRNTKLANFKNSPVTKTILPSSNSLTSKPKSSLNSPIKQDSILRDQTFFYSPDSLNAIFSDSINYEQATIDTLNFKALANFPLLYSSLKSLKKERVINLEMNPLSNAEIKKRFGKQLSATVFLDALGYPYFRGNAQNWIGWKAGVAFQYPIAPKWAANIGISYYQRKGNFDRSTESTSKQYSFGVSEKVSFLSPENLHYLEIPVQIGFIKNRNQFNVGLSYTYLMGIRGSLNAVNDPESNPSPSISILQKGWLAESGFQKHHFNLFFAYQLWVSNKTNLRLRLNYTPSRVIDKNYNAPSGEILKESKEILLEFGIGYRLF